MFPFGNNSIIEPSKYFKNGLFLIFVEISIQTKTEKNTFLIKLTLRTCNGVHADEVFTEMIIVGGDNTGTGEVC